MYVKFITVYINLRNRLLGYFLPDESSCDRCLCPMSETQAIGNYNTCQMFVHVYTCTISGLMVDINVNVTISIVHANKFRELAVTIACLTPCFFPEL